MTSATSPFLVVLASNADAAAARFAADAPDQVRVMTPADLSQPGWSLEVTGAGSSIAVVAGEQVSSRRIAGVVTRLAAVTECDLPHIVAADRAYVAAEMTAFLLAWLTSLQCPVVNRPTAQCLAGPHWRQAQWTVAANRLGIPAVPPLLRANPTELRRDQHEPAGTTSIVVIGRHHVGAADPVLAAHAHALADAAGADLLSVRFDGAGSSARFVAASLWPDLGDARVSDAVLRLIHVRASGACDLREAG